MRVRACQVCRACLDWKAKVVRVDAVCSPGHWDGLPVPDAAAATKMEPEAPFISQRGATCLACPERATCTACENMARMPCTAFMRNPRSECPAEDPRWLKEPITPSKEIPDGR